MDRVDEFKRDLGELDPRHVVQKHITFGDTAILDRGQHFALRRKIADNFGVHPQAVVVVGSAKLGFSIKPNRRYGTFNDQSDIDVAIVSQDLFLRYWRGVLAHMDAGSYWEHSSRFQTKVFEGWVRPDLLPPGSSYAPTSLWWEFFRALTRSGAYGPYKIAAGIYCDWDFLERYQLRAVAACQSESATP